MVKLLGPRAHGSLVALCGSVYTLCIVVMVFCSITPKWQRATIVYDKDFAVAAPAYLDFDLGFWRTCSQTNRPNQPTNTRCGFVEFTSCDAPFVNDSGLASEEALEALGVSSQPESPVPLNHCSAYDAARVFSVIATAALLAMVLALRRWRFVPWPLIVGLALVNLLGHCVVLGAWGGKTFSAVGARHMRLGYVYYIWVAAFVVSLANTALHIFLVYGPQVEAGKADQQMADQQSLEPRRATSSASNRAGGAGRRLDNMPPRSVNYT